MHNKYLNNFIMLAVLVVVVFFAHSLYSGGLSLFTSSGLADTSTPATSTTASSGVPLFVMPATTVSAGGHGAATGGTTDGNALGSTATTGALATSFTKIGNASPPATSAQSYLVADLGTGAVIASKDPNDRWPTASLTKLMTATVVEDEFASSTWITITDPMFAVDPTDETTLVLNGTYSVSGLLHAMLLPSSNVAAQAFADFYGYAGFLKIMNARAAAWGMTNTYFDDPSGLSAGDQSTANDFLALARVIYAHYPEIFAITRTPQVYITEHTSGAQVLVRSINAYAGDPDFIGGKTGNTPQANGNLLSVFRYDGHPLFIVVLGASRSSESDLSSAFTATNALYGWFKANYR